MNNNNIYNYKDFSLYHQDVEWLKRYYSHYKTDCFLSQEKGIRRSNIKEFFSEMMVCLVLLYFQNRKLFVCKSRENGEKKFDVLELGIEEEKFHEVKCSTSTGPISFSPKTFMWDSLFLLKIDLENDVFSCYENTSRESVEQINTKEGETLLEAQKRGVRPRVHPKELSSRAICLCENVSIMKFLEGFE